MKFEKTNSLYLPKVKEKTPQQKLSEMPMFQARTFTVYYSGDCQKFKDLVIKLGGIVETSISVKRFNYINQHTGYKHMIIYYYYKDIDMEVCT